MQSARTRDTTLDSKGLEDLVLAMARGDEDALSRIYKSTFAEVFAIARCMLRCREDAEEIVLDVYACAWERAAVYDAKRGTVMAWLAVMARNRSVDRLRQRRQCLSLDDEQHEALAASLVNQAPSPEHLLAEFESGVLVHGALGTLSLQRRRLLGMAFFDGLSHQEIADVEGLPLGTVKSHVRRAMAKLKGQLRNAPVGFANRVNFDG
jgi:RNA polymerase sigma-70 factor, ECF subfamily